MCAEGKELLNRGQEQKCKDTQCVHQGWGIKEPLVATAWGPATGWRQGGL